MFHFKLPFGWYFQGDGWVGLSALLIIVVAVIFLSRVRR